ncbi:MAG: hypothetical protein ACLR7W_19255 [Ruminococcus sp.]
MKMKYNGIADAAARFVEKEQLKNRSLWKLTADQFANCPDDGDLGWRGEYWGKLMRGACETYLYTRDEELYEILTESVDQLLFLSGWGRQNFHIQQRSRIPGMGYVGQEICTYGADQLL